MGNTRAYGQTCQPLVDLQFVLPVANDQCCQLQTLTVYKLQFYITYFRKSLLLIVCAKNLIQQTRSLFYVNKNVFSNPV